MARDHHANIATALRVQCRHRMDRIPVPDQLCGRALE